MQYYVFAVDETPYCAWEHNLKERNLRFVEDLEARTDVKLYLKLPYWFTVPTPVGEYRPDWAIVMMGPEENGKPVLYLVSETKESPKKDGLRPNEWRRIQCGAAHFGSRQFNRMGALEGVDYCVVKEASELPSVHGMMLSEMVW